MNSMVSTRRSGPALAALLLAAAAAGAADLSPLHALIKPQPGEAKWASIPWETNLAKARERSAKEDKPLFVWRAGGGEVLGRA